MGGFALFPSVLLTGCELGKKRPIVYDEAHSIAVGIPNQNCNPAYVDRCRQDAIAAEQEYAKELQETFSAATECKGIDFIVDKGDGGGSLSDAQLPEFQKGRFWQLRVDYRAHVAMQEATMQRKDGGPTYNLEEGATGAHNLMQSACKVSRDGGIFHYW